MQISGGLLLLFGIGSILGPLIGGILMSQIGPHGLFISTIIPHVLILLFGLWRLTQRNAVEVEDKTTFVPIAPMRTRTPQTIVLSDDDLVEEFSEDIAI